MGIEFTVDQKKIIEARDCSLIVSAAAGSGKTAVLVERIIGLITDPENPVDIDTLLVVTFTNAAAAQMKDKIREAITKRLEETPDDANLLRQSTLIHNARISTIDSFCQYVLRNSFADIDIENKTFSFGWIDGVYSEPLVPLPNYLTIITVYFPKKKNTDLGFIIQLMKDIKSYFDADNGKVFYQATKEIIAEE